MSTRLLDAVLWLYVAISSVLVVALLYVGAWRSPLIAVVGALVVFAAVAVCVIESRHRERIRARSNKGKAAWRSDEGGRQ